MGCHCLEGICCFHLQDRTALLGNWLLIQGDPRGKDNILGGDCIGYFQEKKLYEHVPYSEY
jgi:hypothetical protein